MASRSQATVALLMCFNLMFSMVTAQTCTIDHTKLTTTSVVCNLIRPLANIEASLCLCAALRVGILPLILGLGVNATVTVGVYLSICGKTLPTGFSCSSTPPPIVAPSLPPSAPSPPPVAPSPPPTAPTPPPASPTPPPASPTPPIVAPSQPPKAPTHPPSAPPPQSPPYYT